MSGASTVYVTYGPRNLHLKFGQNRVTNLRYMLSGQILPGQMSP